MAISLRSTRLAAGSRCSRGGCRRKTGSHTQIPEQLVCLHKGPDKASLQGRGKTTGWPQSSVAHFEPLILGYRLHSDDFFLQKECPLMLPRKKIFREYLVLQSFLFSFVRLLMIHRLHMPTCTCPNFWFAFSY